MHLRNNKKISFKDFSVKKINTKGANKKIVQESLDNKPIIKTVVKSNMNEKQTYSFELEEMKEMDQIQITDFETMSFVCPELIFWKQQF
jgi:hypothetical protein